MAEGRTSNARLKSPIWFQLYHPFLPLRYLRSGSPGVLCTEKELTRLRGPSWENVIVGAVVEIVVVATAADEDLDEIEVFLALALALASMVGAEARMQEEVVIPSYASCVSVTCALCVCSLVVSFRV